MHLESVFVPLHALVTRASYFRRRCARRRAIRKTDRYVLTLTSRHQTVASSFPRHRDCAWNGSGNGTRAVTVIAGRLPYHLKLGFPGECRAPRRGEADGPTNQNRSPRFPLQTRPRRTQCGVGADESFVTNAECARTRIPVVPLPVADHGARLALAV